jgi:nitrate reductase NapAB chaperone NapD
MPRIEDLLNKIRNLEVELHELRGKVVIEMVNKNDKEGIKRTEEMVKNFELTFKNFHKIR